MLSELKVILFIFAVYFLEKVSLHICKSSPILGNILAGMLLGPCVADIIPHVDAFRLIGKLGVMLLIVEAGLSINFDQLRKVGGRAFILAATGVFFPVLFVFLTFCIGMGSSWKSALAIGAALAPTSLGFSAYLLKEHGELDTPLGNLICTAAVFDDVMSLLLLAEIQALKGSPDLWDIIAPILGSVGSLVIGGCAAYYLSQNVNNVPSESSSHTLTLLCALSCLFAYGSYIAKSSDLLGCFLAGVTFSSVPNIQKHWEENCGQMTEWGSRLFFAATIAFGFPAIGPLFNSESVWKASILLAYALIGKFATGMYASPFNWSTFLVIGSAMNGRGEFSFLIADDGFEEGIISEKEYSATILALLVTVLLTPYMFRATLERHVKIYQSGSEIQI